MNIGVFLAVGESIKDLKAKGQDSLFINNNLKNYSRNFTRVYVFSYENEKSIFFGNVYILPNKLGLHRYLYSLIGPLLHWNYLKSCSIFRAYQLTGIMPAAIAKILWKKKIVLNYGYPYEQVADLEGKTIIKLALKLVEILLLPFADTLIITQNFLKGFLPQKLHVKTILIPNSVDTAVFKPIKTAKKYNIVFVGRLEKQKNLPLLIKALASLPPKKRTLLIIGKGTQRKQIQALCQLFQVRLKLYSKITNIKLPQYLNRAKIFVLPSIVEGHPKALLEAMSCGLPCIGNQIISLKNVIDKNSGLLFANTTQELSAKIKYLLDNPQVAGRLGIGAREKVLIKYNLTTNNKLEINALRKKL